MSDLKIALIVFGVVLVAAVAIVAEALLSAF